MRRAARSSIIAALLIAVLMAATGATTAAQSPTVAPAEKTVHAVNLTAKLKIKPQGSAFVGSGAAWGTPFGAGRGRLRSTVKTRGPLTTASTFTIVTTKGNVVFKGTGRYVGRTFKVTMRAVSGAGAYRGVTGSHLAVTVVTRNGVDLLRMKGNVRY